MLVMGKCPNCGANIKVDSNKDAAICEFCGTPFIVEKAVENYNINITNNVTNNIKADKVVVDGFDLEKELKIARNIIINNIEDLLGDVDSEDIDRGIKIYKTILKKYPSNAEAHYIVSYYNSRYKDNFDIESYTYKLLDSFNNDEIDKGAKRMFKELLCEVSDYFILTDNYDADKHEHIFKKNHPVDMYVGIFTKKEVKDDLVRQINDIKHYLYSGNKIDYSYAAEKLSKLIAIQDVLAEFDPTYQKEEFQMPKAKHCYIATCVYGSYDCPEVWVLRRYRDYKLSTTWYGKLFIKFYYFVSPKLVKLFGNTKWFKNIWKRKLDKMITSCKEKGFEDTPYCD